MMVARYDGLADWYDEEFQPAPLEGDAWQVVKPLIGEGSGKLLDLGCGTGAYAAALAELGWTVTGVDVSDDMLRRAREREVSVVRSDATGLPFEDASFDAAVSIFTHSDFDDFPAAVCEVARVLKDGAPFVYVGVHPCFVGPHSLYVQAIGVPQLHEGWYRREGHYMEAPGISPEGLRARFGGHAYPARTLPAVVPRRGLPLRAHPGAGGPRLPVHAGARAPPTADRTAVGSWDQLLQGEEIAYVGTEPARPPRTRAECRKTWTRACGPRSPSTPSTGTRPGRGRPRSAAST